MDRRELYHYGIKGQKWGIRRYQNKDGTLTEAGKKRAEKLEKEYEDLTGKKPTSEGSSAKKSVKDMTDEELNKAVNRLQLEQRYKSLNPEKVSTGEKFIQKVSKDIVVPAATNASRNALQNALEPVLTDKLKKAVAKSTMKAIK